MASNRNLPSDFMYNEGMLSVSQETDWLLSGEATKVLSDDAFYDSLYNDTASSLVSAGNNYGRLSSDVAPSRGNLQCNLLPGSDLVDPLRTLVDPANMIADPASRLVDPVHLLEPDQLALYEGASVSNELFASPHPAPHSSLPQPSPISHPQQPPLPMPPQKPPPPPLSVPDGPHRNRDFSAHPFESDPRIHLPPDRHRHPPRFEDEHYYRRGGRHNFRHDHFPDEHPHLRRRIDPYRRPRGYDPVFERRMRERDFFRERYERERRIPPEPIRRVRESPPRDEKYVRRAENPTSRSPSRDRRDSRSFDNRSDLKSSTRKRERISVKVDDSVPDIDSVIDIEEEIKTLKASYIQSTQHGNMYKRILHNDSTVIGTEKLKDLYDRFEQTLSKRHQSLWKPNENMGMQDEAERNVDMSIYLNKSIEVTSAKLQSTTFHEPTTRHQRVKASMIVKKHFQSAKQMKISFKEYLDQVKPSLPLFCMSKLKTVVETGEDLKEDDIDEPELDEAGQFLQNIKKLKAHPDRLHEELWYNEPGQANDGPLCHCAAEARLKGIRHGLYPGELDIPCCNQMENNIGKLYHYRVMVGPAVNFMSSLPTLIEHNDHDYIFEGFSIFSHQSLSEIPFCDIIRFHIRYTIILIEETPPENFCMRGLELFHEYFFKEILELYDWQKKDQRTKPDTKTESFRQFRFYPRFVRAISDNGKEFLSLCKVLQYLLEQDRPLVDEKDLDYLDNCSHEQWLEYTDQVRGMIVTYPGKKPSSLRVDQLDRYNRKPVEKSSQTILPVDERYPMIVHFGIRPANLSYAGDPTYQRLWRSYLKLRHLMMNAPTIKASDKKKLSDREKAMDKIRRTKTMQREVTVELSSKGFRRTGIYPDMCQHGLLLPVLTHHLRYYLCLAGLEKTIGYVFKERKWLSHAMNHPSSKMNFGLNPDHVRNALSNCGLRVPKYGDSSIHYKYTRKRGITNLIRIMARLGQRRPVLSPIEHNERLEFLGDAVVGYFTTAHLFLLFPELSEGSLTTFRTVLVNNRHLASLAERLKLDEYMLYSHGPDLCRKADLRHAMANCFEALMGAIFMEAGLDRAQELFGKFLWDSQELHNVWKELPLHPLQEEEPDGDRRFIDNIPVLQKLAEFESAIGVEFQHIRLLAKAFTWRDVHDNVLTYGNNQRLEFLGDSVCNLVASEYLFRFYPTHHEGHLTLLRATMVNGQTQSMVATELGMPKYVISGQSSDGSQEWRVKNLADLLESFVAALYLDKGIKHVEGLMEVCFFPRLKEFILTQEWNDPKSCLQQCCLTLRQEGKEPQLPVYKVTNEGGPSHARNYKVSVYFLDKEIGKGEGDNVRKAQRVAARNALNEYNFPQLEWQRRYVAQKHNISYQPRTQLKKLEDDEATQSTAKRIKLGDEKDRGKKDDM